MRRKSCSPQQQSFKVLEIFNRIKQAGSLLDDLFEPWKVFG
jgi:hypothetical protein